MKKVLLYLALAVYALSVQAQFGHGRHGLNLGDETKKEQKAPSEESTHQQTIPGGEQHRKTNIYTDQNTIASKDSAYYAKIVKKNGWLIGVGKKLTQKDASHLNCYYKLSKKNNAGNWTFIEAFNGYGDPTTYHDMGTYLANQYDDEDKGLNSEWREKLQTVCKWEMIADASGKEVIQERALDSDGDIVYIYSPVKVGEREYTGSFTDSWGMPIFMRTDSLGNDAGFANYVHITRDERGFEVLFSYTDRFGFPQKNKDGAYMTRKTYDDKGNSITEASLNIVGDKMIDICGNCGWEETFNNCHRVKAKYFDAEWKPMIFPNLRNEAYQVYGFKFETDEYGRDTAMVVINANDEPDVDKEYGIHKIVNRYNEHGKQIFQANYDLNGKLVAGNKWGIAQTIYDFTSTGQIKLIEYKDAKGTYVNGPNGYCKSEYVYDDDFINVSQIDYKINSDDELVPVFVFSRDKIGNKIRKWPLDDQVRIDSVDVKGRNTLTAWYDLQGNPIEYEGMHKDVTIYDDVNNIETETWFDKDGDEFVDSDRGYSKHVTITDSLKKTITHYKYLYGVLKEGYVQQFDSKFDNVIEQWDITPYGEHTRVGWYNNLHYTCKVDYTMYGKIRTMVGRNEFDEPAYLTFLGNSGEVYYFSDTNNGHRRYYDEFGVEVPDSMMSDFKNKLPKVYCIEVTDTAIAYPLGLRNGDIILSYGDWITEKDLITNVDYFYLETILKANHSKSVSLLRHHPEKNSSEILSLNLPEGRTSDLGFYPHKIYYTQKEKQRLLNACKKYNFDYIPLVAPSDTTVLLAVQTKGKVESTWLYHSLKYNVKDPGVVLYAKEKYNKGVDTWSMLNTIDKWNRQDMFRIKGANLYLTQDMSTTRHINKQSKGLGGMTFVPINVDMETYNRLLACYQSLGDSITSEKKPLVVSPSALNIKEKKLLGNWNTKAQLNDEDIKVTLGLLKSGEASFRAEAELQDESMNIVLEITANNGEWSLENGCITLNFSNATNDCKILSIDMPGADEEQKNSMATLVNMFIESEKENLTDKFSVSQVFNSDSFPIKSLKAKTLIVIDGDEERTFIAQ